MIKIIEILHYISTNDEYNNIRNVVKNISGMYVYLILVLFTFLIHIIIKTYIYMNTYSLHFKIILFIKTIQNVTVLYTIYTYIHFTTTSSILKLYKLVVTFWYIFVYCDDIIIFKNTKLYIGVVNI